MSGSAKLAFGYRPGRFGYRIRQLAVVPPVAVAYSIDSQLSVIGKTAA
ncbi:hypothetical protein ACFPAF_11370 [Hymenobacter endophyticus]|uniref:Uncharacterized protein n=1 Tax=Hymenobacter endophyticus TaxID=3076335 RepID=A0ABU3THZ0_9BACT|nr:hypothetical protein [Hymenobacter endophyticus]MDU0370996.1 hypothetical protein [Hymenobacter endophyticus]